MGDPLDDLGPVWLRDWTSIEADLERMADFAAKLRAEVQLNYVPHLQKVYNDMASQLPPPASEFGELVNLLTVHNQSQTTTADNVHSFANASGGFAAAADDISKRYGQSDAFSAARVTVVEAALSRNGVTQPAGAADAPPPGHGPQPGESQPPGVPDPGSRPTMGG